MLEFGKVVSVIVIKASLRKLIFFHRYFRYDSPVSFLAPVGTKTYKLRTIRFLLNPRSQNCSPIPLTDNIHDLWEYCEIEGVTVKVRVRLRNPRVN